jgi:hypothetical protein
VFRRKLRQADVIELVRETANQTSGSLPNPLFSADPPVRKSKKGEFLRDRNGRSLLQVTGNPGYGLSWGQDRLLSIFLRTKLSSVRDFTGGHGTFDNGHLATKALS